MESKLTDWQADLGSLMAENKIFRTDFLNKQLVETVAEWTNYLEKFDGVTADLDSSGENHKSDTIINPPPPAVKIEIKISSNHFYRLLPFIINLRYIETDDHSICLAIKYSNGLDLQKAAEEEPSSTYIFKEENIEDELIHEKEFVQQILNNIFRKQLKIENH